MVQRLSTRVRLGHADDAVRQALLHGTAFRADEDGLPLSVPSHKELRAAWEKDRNTLLPQFIAENPGSRPWGWWQFSAPEPIPPRFRWQLHIERKNGVRFRDRWKISREQQCDFLEKRGLLTPAEIAALGPQ